MGFRHPVGQCTTQSWLPRARSVLLAVLSAEVAVLVVTGIALYFLYRPTARQAWGDLVAETYDWDVRIALASGSFTDSPPGSQSSPHSPSASWLA